MKDDLLDSATRALREDTAQPESSAKFTRARVMASVHSSQVRRRTRLALLLPIAACFAAASAFGMASGRAPALVRDVARVFGLESGGEAAPAAAPKSPRRAASSRRAPSSALSAPVPPAASPPGEAAPQPANVIAEHAAPTKPSAPPAAPATPKADPAHELYRAAHRAHFNDQDFSRALAGWEAYLSKAPRGRFAIEAEYNRALCLARLGRNAEARRALAPFAAGERGGYRRPDASDLLDALGD